MRRTNIHGGNALSGGYFTTQKRRFWRKSRNSLDGFLLQRPNMSNKKEMAKQLIEELYTLEDKLESTITEIRNIEAALELYFPEEYEKWNVVGLVADAVDFSAEIRKDLLDKHF
jgi:hypothetical protein